MKGVIPMCFSTMRKNEDGTYTVTFENETRVFPDCIAAADWIDRKRFDIEKEETND